MPRHGLVAAAACGALVLRASAELDAIRVDPVTGNYIDSFGRTRLFHGVNVVYKKLPWFPPSDRFTPTDSLDPDTMEKLREWGFNVVRLGVMWPGVEPRPGAIDHGYLAAIENLTRGLAEHGVYTIADLHQDVGSRRFCGEGIPEHYVDALLTDPGSRLAQARLFPAPVLSASDLPLNASGFPDLEDCLKFPFAFYYGSEQVAALWEELYTPGTELQRGFLRYWGAVAAAFKGAPQVLAYELLNEPTGLCIGTPFCKGLPDAAYEVFGNRVEAEKLTPLYRAAAQEIRAAGAGQPILYEATVLPKVAADVFPAPPLGEDSQQGLAYHIYCQPGDGGSPAAGRVCSAAQGLFEHTYFSFLDKYPQIGGFMTEFGDVGGNKGELKHLNWLLDAADRNFQSWAYWQLKTYQDFTTANPEESFYDSEGRLNVPKLKALSRTYAPAIAGTPLRMFFDHATAAFELEFTASIVGVPTEIYLNEELHYPEGFTAQADPPHCFTMSTPERNWIHFNLTEDSSCINTVAKVNVWAARASGSKTFLI